MCQSFDCYWEMDIIDLLLLGCLPLELFFFFFLLGPFNVANEPWQFFIDPFGKFLRYSSYELEFQLLLVLIALLMPTPCQKKQNIVILIWLNSFFRSNVSRFWKVYYSFCICRWLLSMLLGFSTIAYLLYVLTWLTFALTLIVVLYLGCFCWPIKRGHYRMLVQCLS